MKSSITILADEGCDSGATSSPRFPRAQALLQVAQWIYAGIIYLTGHFLFLFVRRSNRFSRLAHNRNRCALRTKELSAPDVVKRWVSLLRTHTGHDVRRPCRCRRSCITFLATRRGKKSELCLNQIRRKAIAVFRKENTDAMGNTDAI